MEAAHQVVCGEQVYWTKNNRKVAEDSDLKVGQLVFVRDYCKCPFDPTYTFDHMVAAIVNKSTVVLTIPDNKEKRCNIHCIKLMSVEESTAGAFQQFWVSIQNIQLAYSKVTSIICVQETISCSKAQNAKLSNFNNFTMKSISIHLLPNWCEKQWMCGLILHTMY